MSVSWAHIHVILKLNVWMSLVPSPVDVYRDIRAMAEVTVQVLFSAYWNPISVPFQCRYDLTLILHLQINHLPIFLNLQHQWWQRQPLVQKIYWCVSWATQGDYFSPVSVHPTVVTWIAVGVYLQIQCWNLSLLILPPNHLVITCMCTMAIRRRLLWLANSVEVLYLLPLKVLSIAFTSGLHPITQLNTVDSERFTEVCFTY